MHSRSCSWSSSNLERSCNTKKRWCTAAAAAAACPCNLQQLLIQRGELYWGQMAAVSGRAGAPAPSAPAMCFSSRQELKRSFVCRRSLPGLKCSEETPLGANVPVIPRHACCGSAPIGGEKEARNHNSDPKQAARLRALSKGRPVCHMTPAPPPPAATSVMKERRVSLPPISRNEL